LEGLMREAKIETEQQLVLFDLALEHYAIDSMNVREIIRMQSITKIPGAPASVEGVINLRGKVTPVMDLRKRLGLAVSQESKETRIVVVEVEGQDVGLIVDGVSEVLRIPVSVIEPTSTIVAAEEADYILGVAKLETKLVILLDIGRLLVGGEKRMPLGVEKGGSQAVAAMPVS
jgi:purine-binding chemotaxis protein CheW